MDGILTELIRMWWIALPVFVYLLWRSVRHRDAEGNITYGWPSLRRWVLIMVGLLVFVALVAFAVLNEPKKNGRYIPAHIANGELVEGRFVPDDWHEGQPQPKNIR